MLAWSSINNYQLLGFALFGLLGGLVMLLILAALRARRKGFQRQKQLVQLADKLGLAFNPHGRPQIRHLPWSREEGAHAINTLAGQIRNRRIVMGDVYYIEPALASRTDATADPARDVPLDRYSSYCRITDLDADFPALTIRPEQMWDKSNPILREEDIDFESSAFSSCFFVRCRDRKFAYATVTPVMMEFCLRHPHYLIQLAGNALVVTRSDMLWTAQQFDETLTFALQWLDLVPEHCWADHPQPPVPEPVIEVASEEADSSESTTNLAATIDFNTSSEPPAVNFLTPAPPSEVYLEPPS